MDANLLLVAVMILVLVAIAGVLHWRRHTSHELERRFGPEYGRAVEDFGSRAKAEAELTARQKRVEQLEIVPLSPADATRFADQWKTLQERFVDSPQGSLAEADKLVRELMERRGYPMADFERRAADISVHHPQVVDHYRAAHEIANRGEADTEGMRQAVIHYRALFAELLETQPAPEAAAQSQLRTQS
jgi:cell pole-organizing protein PopZ